MAHLLVLELLGEELVLVADLGLRTHAGGYATGLEPLSVASGPTTAVVPRPAQRPPMRLRGRRECTACGERWSYFETADVACPACGSPRSVAVEGEAVLHTAGGATLDLEAARAAVEDRPVRAVARDAAEAARSFLAERGFIDGGELRPLDEVTVAAAELRQVADQVKRELEPDEDAEWHLLALLRGAPEGDRPESVPAVTRSARGLGVAAAVERYRVDLARYLDDHPDPEARRRLGSLRDHLRRIEALEGDVPPEQAERLLAAARDLGAALRGEDGALSRADDRLSRF